MADALKDSFGPDVPVWIADHVAATDPAFDHDAFVAECLVGYADLELMDRARHVADVLTRFLPEDPKVAVPIIAASIGPADPSLTGMATMRYLPFSLCVAQIGLPAFEESMAAQYELTKRFSAEFSIRAFLRHDTERTLARLRVWASDPNEHVRRLVSEGSRPRLPWAARLEMFVAEPDPVLDLLELLRDDPSEYVRRSVANSLNDISKDHPERVVELATRWWVDADDNRRRLLRHALRTLVKRGDPAALAVLGHGPSPHLTVTGLTVDPVELPIGGRVRISGTVRDTRDEAAEANDVVVDFVVHFVKANGSTSRRVFKGGRPRLGGGDSASVRCSVSVAQLSTRTHHPGRHRVEVQVNGTRAAAAEFLLVAPADSSADHPSPR